MTGVITLALAGTGTGPFYIYSNVDGFILAFASNIPKETLLAGYPTDQIPAGTTIVRVKSLNDVCNNYIDIVIPPQACFNFLPAGDINILSQISEPTLGYFYGDFTEYQETGVITSFNHLIKLNIDLTVDTSFNIGTGFDEILYTGSSIIKQSDGKIIVTGTFTTYQGVSANRIIRLNANGTRDTSFVIGTGFNGFTQQPRLTSTEKIVVTGLWSDYNGYAANRLIRLNTDGSADTTLVIGTGFDNTTLDVLVNTDDSMIVTGYFDNYNGTPANGMVKLDSLGIIDPTFVVGIGLDPHGVLSPTYLSRIPGESSFFATGAFIEYKGVPEPHIIKINQFGDKDTSFNAGIGFNSPSYSIYTVWGDKLFIQGYFTSYDGVSAASGFIVLNANGSVLYSEESLTYFSSPIIIGNNLFGTQSGGCMELLYTFIPVPVTTTTTTTTIPVTTTTTTTTVLGYNFWLSSTDWLGYSGVDSAETLETFIIYWGGGDVVVTDFSIVNDGELKCNVSFSTLTNVNLENCLVDNIITLNAFNTVESLYLTNNSLNSLDCILSFTNLLYLNINNNLFTTAGFNTLNDWALIAPDNGFISAGGNIDNFNTSTTYTTLLGKGWTIS